MRRIPLRVYIIAYVVLIAVLSLMPGNDIPDVDLPDVDKLVHLLMYAGLGYLSASAFSTCPLKWRQVRFWLFIMLFTYGFLLEFAQELFPALHRSFSYWDAAFNGLGAITGISLRLKRGYRICRCQCSNQLHTLKIAARNIREPSLKPSEGKMLISHNPGLPDIISKAFRWKTVYYDLDDTTRITFVCTGKSLVSLPHFSYGAVFSSSESTLGTDWKTKLTHLAGGKGYTNIEVRSCFPQSDNYQKVASWLLLQKSKDAQDKLFTSNLKRKIRKASKNGFEVKQGGIELLDDFYRVYSRHIRFLGSGALSRHFFSCLLKEYTNGYAGIFLVMYHNKVIGGAINLEYKGFYENCWFATLKKYQRAYASYVLHDRMIAHAISLNAHTYSFGRSSRNTGVHEFKKQWGATDVPLQWFQIPAETISLRRQEWLKKLWKQLPWPLGNRFGNYMAKWVY